MGRLFLWLHGCSVNNSIKTSFGLYGYLKLHTVDIIPVRYPGKEYNQPWV